MFVQRTCTDATRTQGGRGMDAFHIFKPECIPDTYVQASPLPHTHYNRPHRLTNMGGGRRGGALPLAMGGGGDEGFSTKQ